MVPVICSMCNANTVSPIDVADDGEICTTCFDREDGSVEAILTESGIALAPVAAVDRERVERIMDKLRLIDRMTETTQVFPVPFSHTKSIRKFLGLFRDEYQLALAAAENRAVRA